jgi:hypothetical protein
LPDWRPNPDTEQARLAIVQAAVRSAPFLIPIYAHRYIPSDPNAPGNPVFSVYQTDIIHYGCDLADYFHQEFHAPLPDWAARSPKPIRFWGESVDWRGDDALFANT